MNPIVIRRDEFQSLFDLLVDSGYSIVGPTVSDAAIIYDVLNSVEDLPIGYADDQDAGKYRLRKRRRKSLFGFTVGPHSWKKFLHPPAVRLWSAERANGRMSIVEEGAEAPRYAFLGVRSCELHAIQIQDRVFTGGEFVDPTYKLRREKALIIVVNCTQAGKTCFCASMNTGPKADAGFDLAITELLDTDSHEFLIETGSTRGEQLLNAFPHRPAERDDINKAAQASDSATAQMGRHLDTGGIRELLQDNAEHPRWQEVASRCINCANCTMVCPTCFCTTMEDTTDLSGHHAERWRKWDSCFTVDFSYIHGGSVRPSAMARYRQWMTHKLSTWYDQFGTSGCVGCGRCITWCPVGIDITEEVRAIQQNTKRKRQPVPVAEGVS